MHGRGTRMEEGRWQAHCVHPCRRRWHGRRQGWKEPKSPGVGSLPRHPAASSEEASLLGAVWSGRGNRRPLPSPAAAGTAPATHMGVHPKPSALPML